MGNAIPKIPTEEIGRIAETTMKTFTPQYVKHAGVAIVKQAKEKAQAAPSRYLLEDAPTPSEPLKTGYLTKLGAVRKNWKKRWFVALNKKDNFAVRYYASEADAEKAPEKPLGTISLCWYKVRRSETEDEKKANGEFSAILAPWWSSDERRTWAVRADDEASLKEWMDAFKIGCDYARAPRNPDPVLASAFDGAYRETRWKLGSWGWYGSYSSEEQQLGLLVGEQCASCMSEVYAGIPARMENIIRPRVRAAVMGTISVAVGAGWKQVVAQIGNAKPDMQKKVEASLGGILSKQEELKGKVAASVAGLVKPAVKVAADKVVDPVLAALLGPLQTAFAAALTVFIAKARAAVTKAAEQADPAAASKSLASSLKDLSRETNWYWGAFHDSWVTIDDMVRGKSPAVGSVGAGGASVSISLSQLDKVLNGVELWRIGRWMEDGMRATLQAAAYTLGKEAAAAGAPSAATKAAHEAVLASVTARLIHDAKVRGAEIMHTILAAVIMDPIAKELTPSLQAPLSPIKALVPEDLAPLMDVDGMVEDVMNDTLSSAVDPTILPATARALAPLDASAFGGVAIQDFTASWTDGAKAAGAAAGAGAGAGAGSARAPSPDPAPASGPGAMPASAPEPVEAAMPPPAPKEEAVEASAPGAEVNAFA